MPNLTITVPDDVLRQARARAAQQGTSVSRVLRRSLEQYIDADADIATAWDEFLSVAENAGGRSPEGHRVWNRNELQRNKFLAS